MTAGTRWIGIIVGFLAANVCATSALIAESHHDASRVIPSYYERAVRYDDALDEASRSAALGWRVVLALAPDGMRVTGHDRAGRALVGVNVRVSAVPRAAGLPEIDTVLGELGHGDYRAPVTVARGWYDANVVVERGAERFVHSFATEVR